MYLGSGFQPQVERAVGQLAPEVVAVDLLGTVELLPVTAPLAGVPGEVDGEVLAGGLDPHAWVSPRRLATMVTELTGVLTRLAPQAAVELDAASTAYLAELDALDHEFTAASPDARAPRWSPATGRSST